MLLQSSDLSTVFSSDLVDVWEIPIVGREAGEELPKILNAEERDRAGRYISSSARTAFEICRIALRLALGRYLQANPDDIEFSYTTSGKPSLPGSSGLHFNVAHSHGRAVLGFTVGSELGIDLEKMEEIVEYEAVAKTIMSGVELDAFTSLPTSSKQSAFYRAWTRKEAYLKATGEGLAGLPGWIEPRFEINENSRSQPASTLQANAEWRLHDLQISETYAGALVYQGVERSTRYISISTIEELIRLR